MSHMVCRCFFLFCGLFLFMVSLAVQKLLGLIMSHFKIFCFYFHNSGRILSINSNGFTIYSFKIFFQSLCFCLAFLCWLESSVQSVTEVVGAGSDVLFLVLQECFQQGLLFCSQLEGNLDSADVGFLITLKKIY